MRESVNLTGIVLKASPVGDNDRRLVILTRERGKITAFARGAKRPGSQLMGVTRPFVFGTFKLYEGRDAYNLQGADVLNYFAEIPLDMEAACYGSYFLEFADYYGRENLEATEQLLLLYQSLRALFRLYLSFAAWSSTEIIQNIRRARSVIPQIMPGSTLLLLRWNLCIPLRWHRRCWKS